MSKFKLEVVLEVSMENYPLADVLHGLLNDHLSREGRSWPGIPSTVRVLDVLKAEKLLDPVQP